LEKDNVTFEMFSSIKPDKQSRNTPYLNLPSSLSLFTALMMLLKLVMLMVVMGVTSD